MTVKEKEVQLNKLLRDLVAAHPENKLYPAELKNSNNNLKEAERVTYKDETVAITHKRAEELKAIFVNEVDRLLRSGGIDPESHSRGLLFGVALENMADDFLRGERKSKSYKNLKHF